MLQQSHTGLPRPTWACLWQVFLPNILSVDVHPRGPFWCKAEDLLLHWGLTIHQGNWEVIQQTYLPGKKAKEIEHREGSTEKRRRIKVMKGVSLDDLVPQVRAQLMSTVHKLSKSGFYGTLLSQVFRLSDT